VASEREAVPTGLDVQGTFEFPANRAVAAPSARQILVYTLLGAYIPAKRRAASLEKELRALYAQEAELHTKVAQNENRQTLRDQQLIAVTRERDALARKLQEVQRELEAMRRR